MKRVLAVSTAAALLFALGACGDSTSANKDAGLVLGDLDGKTYVADQVTDPSYSLVAGTQIRLTFTADRIGAHAGCNSMSGGAKIDDGKLVVEPLATTEMACAEDKMAQDTWFADFLGKHPAIELAGDQLTLTAGETVLTLTEEVVVAAPLEGTQWELETVYSGAGPDGAASTPPAGSHANLSIEGDALQVNTGCNNGRATVSYDDSTLTVGPLALTRMACEPQRMDLERTFTKVLESSPGYLIEGDTLTITAADGSAGLGFRAAK